MCKWRLLGLSLLPIIVLVPQTTYAHVLIRDNDKQSGAILHINPDDDPAAGRPSNLFFDIQNQNLENDQYEAELKITDFAGEEVNPAVSLNGNSVSADYTFPSQGVYNLKLSLKSSKNLYIFEYSQRVARGVSDSTLDEPSHPIAEIALIASLSMLSVLAVIVFNRRHKIARQSKF